MFEFFIGVFVIAMAAAGHAIYVDWKKHTANVLAVVAENDRLATVRAEESRIQLEKIQTLRDDLQKVDWDKMDWSRLFDEEDRMAFERFNKAFRKDTDIN